jgi:predicted ATP-grasp superfamily ATP-dependent carboligase
MCSRHVHGIGQETGSDKKEEGLSSRPRFTPRSVPGALEPRGSDPERPPVLVLGSGITAVGVVRALGRARIPLHVISAHPGPVRASRWYRGPPHGEALSDVSQLADYLRTLPVERAVLMATSDHGALAAATLPPELAERFPASQAPASLLPDIIDKERLRGLLDEHGVPRPRTFTVDGPDAVDSLADEELEHLFIKPRDSQDFNRRLRVKALRPSGRAELRAALRWVEAEQLSVVLQEYVPGPPTNHYFLDGFVDRHGRVRARLARRRLRMSEPEFGNSCATVSVPIEEAAPAVTDLERLFSAVGFRGPYDAEFKLDERTGVFNLIEINVRAWWQVEFAALCGVDVVSMAYRDALELPVQDVLDYEVGLEWILAYYDLAACARLLSTGETTLGACVRSWLRARWGEFAADDPLPGLAQGVALLGRVARRSAARGRRSPQASEPERARVPAPPR